MNKTIAAMTMLVASVAVQARGPFNPTPVEKRTYCLSIYENEDGSHVLGTCDQTERNMMYRLPLNENKCAEGQASFTTVDVEIKSCPTFVQL